MLFFGMCVIVNLFEKFFTRDLYDDIYMYKYRHKYAQLILYLKYFECYE